MAAADWIPDYMPDDIENEPVVVEGKLIHETNKAWLVKIGAREMWLPKSQCQYDGDEFLVPSWLADKKGL